MEELFGVMKQRQLHMIVGMTQEIKKPIYSILLIQIKLQKLFPIEIRKIFTAILEILKPKETATVKIQKNTALVIENTGEVYGSVTLKVKGDLNLGMTYNN